ncbi:hypothetical protein BaRGS_00007070 [Batillaria attramentaria]|uniref:Uncharacterized protein n=1 Tax=Batillaria attramentaria TaxID=370345 RepID=A0ABD0LRK7_9CAEN
MVGEEDGGSEDMGSDTTLSPLATIQTRPAAMYQSSTALYWSSDSDTSTPCSEGPATVDGSREEVTLSNVFQPVNLPINLPPCNNCATNLLVSLSEEQSYVSVDEGGKCQSPPCGLTESFLRTHVLSTSSADLLTSVDARADRRTSRQTDSQFLVALDDPYAACKANVNSVLLCFLEVVCLSCMPSFFGTSEIPEKAGFLSLYALICFVGGILPAGFSQKMQTSFCCNSTVLLRQVRSYRQAEYNLNLCRSDKNIPGVCLVAWVSRPEVGKTGARRSQKTVVCSLGSRRVLIVTQYGHE